MNTQGTLTHLNGAANKPVLMLRQSDNVGVVRQPLNAGDKIEINGRQIEVREAIAPGHKIALQGIAQGAPVIKYGEIIADATCDIGEGAWVHTHNTVPDFSGREYEYG